MQTAGRLTENGIQIGNAYNKYGTGNWIARHLVSGFIKSLDAEVADCKPSSIHEIGCGEGFWTLRWSAQGYHVRGTDFSTKVIELAKANAAQQGHPPTLFQVLNAYEFEPDRDSADILVCCEVLEHLERPEEVLSRLAASKARRFIFSVPREPVWRLMNLMRFKYIAQAGNTPGHLQHWSRTEFVALLSRYFTIENVRSPLPWTMVCCSALKNS